jgi:hypothetical protein
MYRRADAVREKLRVVHKVRALATRLGSEDPRAWYLLELAVKTERDAFLIEAEMDGILAALRTP